MNKRILSSLLAFVIVFGGVNFTLLNAASHEDHGHDHTPLGEEMETISKSFRKIRRQARDSEKNADSAALVGQMLAAAKEAIQYKPVWTEDQPADKQEAFVAAYKEEMEKFIGMLVDLEKAFKDGDNAAAQEIIGKLRDQQRSSHKEFKKPDDE